MQEVSAQLKFLRSSPRKMRLLVDVIRGQKVLRAVDQLTLMNKQTARPLLKLLQSVIANAKHNFSLAAEDLRIQTITVDGGPMLKRWMPKAHGRATPVRERTSHIKIVLGIIEKREKKEKEIKKEKLK